MNRGRPVSQHRVGPEAAPLLGGLPPELRGLRTTVGCGQFLETAVVLLHGVHPVVTTAAEESGGELSAVDKDN